MGKDLRGKELGVGLSQRKDGLYTARITNRHGKRVQKYFPKLQEARKWIADAQFNEEHGGIEAGGDMTVDAWFEYWIKNIKSAVQRDTTRVKNEQRYKNAIQPILGRMSLQDVKPIHCQKVLNDMSHSKRLGTIGKTRDIMHSMFESALENDLIVKNPVSRSVVAHSDLEDKTVNILTQSDLKTFLEALTDDTRDMLFRFTLQTGMRVGEVSGLKWSDIDFGSGIIYVNRTVSWEPKMGFVIHEPKTKNGYRAIPMTEESKRILKYQKEHNKKLKKVMFDFRDNVFLTWNGSPFIRANLNKRLNAICEKNNIPHISMHCLRHTFATRCIESGMTPKILQKILGHSSITMTMDLYVHATDETKIREMRAVESSLYVV